MVDIIERNGVVNIKNSSGGGILLDGKKPITEDEVINVLNKRYPIGSKYIFPTGSENPASDIGGDWTLIASNVVIPLGQYAPAVALPKELKTYSGQPLKFRNALGSELNGSSNYYAVFSPKGYFSHQGSNTGSTAMEGMVPSNLWVDLHQSEKLITVDVWERIG